MDEENQTLDTNPGEETISANSAEGNQNDDAVQTATPAITLEEINSLTGHRYETVEDAKKGIDNLKRMVGKKEIVKEVADPTLLQKVQELESKVVEASFYTEHPDLKPHKDILSKFGNPEVAIKDPVVQKVIEAMKAREESEDSKLKSNSRIGQVSSDYQSDFEKAEKTGEWADFLAKHKGIGK